MRLTVKNTCKYEILSAGVSYSEIGSVCFKIQPWNQYFWLEPTCLSFGKAFLNIPTLSLQESKDSVWSLQVFVKFVVPVTESILYLFHSDSTDYFFYDS